MIAPFLCSEIKSSRSEFTGTRLEHDIMDLTVDYNEYRFLIFQKIYIIIIVVEKEKCFSWELCPPKLLIGNKKDFFPEIGGGGVSYERQGQNCIK